MDKNPYSILSLIPRFLCMMVAVLLRKCTVIHILSI